jgi:hypothetical protein
MSRMRKPDNRAIVEEALRDIAEQAAVLRSWAEAGAVDRRMVPSTNLLNGIGEIAKGIELMADTVRNTLPFEALNCRLKRMRP